MYIPHAHTVGSLGSQGPRYEVGELEEEARCQKWQNRLGLLIVALVFAAALAELPMWRCFG